MNIVFFGTSAFAVPTLEKLLDSDHRVLSVVTQPDRRAGRGRDLRASAVKETAVARSVHLYQPENCNAYEFLRELRALSPDAIVMGAYGQRLSREILQLPRYYCLNIHPSLLPRYRGAAPVARSIMHGDQHTGVTIIQTVDKMDAGPILGVTRVPIPSEVTTPEMEEILSKVSADLVLDVLRLIQEKQIIEIPQDEREATFARKFEKGDGHVDWRKTGHRITNFVRAIQPFPGAYSFLNRSRLTFFKVKGNRYPKRPNHRPGTILKADKETFTVACGDGEVTILEVQPESKRRMTAAEYVNGHQPKVGAQLS